ncbi:conserved hypothetical protein [Listeria ivanovii FSL F6-596]|nr:conserved hypothetical protein [Listeria ivanovii FSL F6-596]
MLSANFRLLTLQKNANYFSINFNFDGVFTSNWILSPLLDSANISPEVLSVTVPNGLDVSE